MIADQWVVTAAHCVMQAYNKTETPNCPSGMEQRNCNGSDIIRCLGASKDNLAVVIGEHDVTDILEGNRINCTILKTNNTYMLKF